MSPTEAEWLEGTDYDSWYAEHRLPYEGPPDQEPPGDEDPAVGPEPDYEQILEDRAADREPGAEAIMWGGEDLPS